MTRNNMILLRKKRTRISRRETGYATSEKNQIKRGGRQYSDEYRKLTATERGVENRRDMTNEEKANEEPTKNETVWLHWQPAAP